MQPRKGGAEQRATACQWATSAAPAHRDTIRLAWAQRLDLTALGVPHHERDGAVGAGWGGSG